MNSPDLPAAGPSDPDGASAVLSAEQVRTDTEWIESGRLRLRRRIVAERRTVEVVVRREELVVETHELAPGPIGESFRGTAQDGPVVPRPDSPPSSLVIILREEVPEIVLRPQVYERVTVDVVTASEVAVWHGSARHEEADINVADGPGAAPER